MKHCLIFAVFLCIAATVCYAEETRYALLVGIDQYESNEITPLKGAVNDALALRDVLTDHADFLPENVFCLISTDQANLPTLRNIVIKLGYIVSRMKPSDMFLLFFSGHGISQGENSYLLPYRADMTDQLLLSKSGLSTKEMMKNYLDKIKSGKILLILDSCRKKLKVGRGNEDNIMTDEFARAVSLVTRANANDDVELRATIYACKKGESAYEDTGKRRGFLSIALEEALKGKADENGDNKITLGEVEFYLGEKVPDLVSEKYGSGRKQTPWVEKSGTIGGKWVFSNIGNRYAPGPEVYRLEIDYTEGFQVSLNAEATGKQTPTSFVLSAGQYTVKLTKPRYKTYETAVNLGPQNTLATIQGTGIQNGQPPPPTGYGLLYVKASADGQPTQAKVSVDNQEVGSTPYTDPVIPTGAHRIKVSRQLYHDHEELVTVFKDSKHTVDAVLRPAYGSLKVNSTPSDADVELTDISGTRWGSGKTSYNIQKLPSGNYSLKLSKDRYYENNIPITISDDQITTKSLSLDPKFGILEVNSTPSGINVYLAGKELGNTPIEKEIDSGSYILELRNELYLDWSEQISIRDGEKTIISPNLIENFGELKVEVMPEGSQILVDGKEKGKTPITLKLTPIMHHIKVKHDDYVPQVYESLIIVRGEAETISKPLERKMGTLLLLSEPAEARIIIDGKSQGADGKAYGVTPNIISLPTGSHRLKLTSDPPYQDHEETVDIVWNKTVERNVKLPDTPPTPPGMVLIPAGEFQMGSNDGDDDEKPVHTVYLDAFYIDKYEVTNAQYKKFMDATSHEAPGYWDDSRFNKPDQPVVGASWHDAVAYTKWAGKRLPTEAEWEKAARGGPIRRKYVWGDSDSPPSKAGNFADETAKKEHPNWPVFEGYNDGYLETSPVGSFAPNDYRLYDMAGNVWEWCADWYDKDYYSNSPRSNPKGPSSGRCRVIRSGSWSNNPFDLRVAHRNCDLPICANYLIGFRCAGL